MMKKKIKEKIFRLV